MKILRLLMCTLLVFASCNTDENTIEPIDINSLSISDIENASLDLKIQYKRHHMKILSNWVAQNKNQLLDLMNQNQTKSLNNDFKVFKIEDLVNSSLKKINSKINKKDSKVQKALDAFKSVKGDSWVPIIFLERGSLNTLEKSTDENVTFLAVEDENMEGETLTAYQIEESEGNDDILTPVDEQLTPEAVGDNNLLVMELAFDYEFDDSSGGGSSGGGGGSSTRSLLLDKMKIKDLKEGWPFRSEISMKAYKLDVINNNQTYPCGSAVYSSVNCYTHPGKEIVSLKRKWKNDTRTYNWLIERSTYSSSDIVFYTLYEADWAAPIKSDYISLPNGSLAEITYMSWQRSYDKVSLSLKYNNSYNWDYAYSYEKDNHVINYNLR